MSVIKELSGAELRILLFGSVIVELSPSMLYSVCRSVCFHTFVRQKPDNTHQRTFLSYLIYYMFIQHLGRRSVTVLHF